MSKNYYYIVVLSEGIAKLVTEINNTNKTCKWEKDKKPLAVSKTTAENIIYGLCLNFHPAYLLKSYHKIEKQLFLGDY